VNEANEEELLVLFLSFAAFFVVPLSYSFLAPAQTRRFPMSLCSAGRRKGTRGGENRLFRFVRSPRLLRTPLVQLAGIIRRRKPTQRYPAVAQAFPSLNTPIPSSTDEGPRRVDDNLR
jgi:hypothetical protein